MTTRNTLDTWLAQEQAVRTLLDNGPGPGVAKPEQIAGMNGMEAM